MVNYHSDKAGADATVKSITQAGGKAFAIQADVSKEEDVIKMFEKAVSEFGAIDIVVTNSGIQKDSPIVDMSLEDWNMVIGVNLTGQFLCAREAMRAFVKQGVREGVSRAAGKLISISSVHEIIPWAGHANYAASKGGIQMFMKTLAQEMAPQKIRVNTIAPGAIKTPINKDAWSTQAALADLMKLIPSNRIGEPDDIGKAAVWLASDDSDYVQGISLFVDGGMALYPGFASGG